MGDNVEPTPRAIRTNSWAIASLLCSVAICCPAMTFAAILLGARALVEISAEPDQRGKRLAKAGILIGALATLAWLGGLAWWHFNARLPMLHGPADELKSGLAGDIAGFKSGFAGNGAAASDAEAIAFLNAISTRYGRFIDSSQDVPAATTAPPATTQAATPASFRIPYTLQFEQANLQADAKFITFGETAVLPKPVFKWAWLRIIDAQRGDLVYPDSASVEAKTQAAAATQP